MSGKTSCGDCGKDFSDGDKAIGISAGTIQKCGSDDDGFYHDDGPWIGVLCPDCYKSKQEGEWDGLCPKCGSDEIKTGGPTSIGPPSNWVHRCECGFEFESEMLTKVIT